VVERVVLNALAKLVAASPPDIRVLGDEIRIVFGEADPPSRDCRTAVLSK